MILTIRQIAALRYISGTIGVGPFQVGQYLVAADLASGGHMAVGSGICGSLRKLGMIVYVPGAGWRTTEAGRVAAAAGPRMEPEEG